MQDKMLQINHSPSNNHSNHSSRQSPQTTLFTHLVQLIEQKFKCAVRLAAECDLGAEGV